MDSPYTGPVYEAHIVSQSSYLKRFQPNIYIINRACLKIQHWYFITKAQKDGVADPRSVFKCKTNSPIKPYVKEETPVIEEPMADKYATLEPPAPDPIETKPAPSVESKISKEPPRASLGVPQKTPKSGAASPARR